MTAPCRPVAPVQDDNPVAHIPNERCQSLRRRGFACAAYGNIPKADDPAGQFVLPQKTHTIHGKLAVDTYFIQQGEEPQYETQYGCQ